jgi:hypothetical protein
MNLIFHHFLKLISILIHLPKEKMRYFVSFSRKEMIYIFTLHDGHKNCTAAEKYGIRQLKAGSAAQPKGCSACFVP